MENGFDLTKFKKYHLGCGTIFLKDYLNINFWSHLNKNTVYVDPGGEKGTYLYNYDLVQGIPALSNSLSVIYHCHLLEHLSYNEGYLFSKQCHECLEPGGIMRVVVPDLELWITNYAQNNGFFFEEYRTHVLSHDPEIYMTKGSIFMGMLHNHGHKTGYDYETLKRMLERVGFVKIRRTLVQESDLPDIKDIEPYVAIRAMESLCVECYK
jgi:predicted SAM-dependent methyltransferase